MSEKPTYEELEKGVHKLKRAEFERQEADKELKEVATKWQSTFEAMSDSVWIIDLNGHILEYNSATLKIFDLSDQDIKRKHCWELVHGLSEPIGNCQIVRMKKSKQPESMTFEEKGRWLQVSVDPIFDDTGQMKGAVHVVSDITERKQAEAELRLKNLVFETALTANSTTDNNGILTHVNKAFIRTWGYESKEEAVGKSISEFFKFEDEAKKIITMLNETGEWEGEFTALRKDGTTFVAYGLATIIKDEPGNIIGYQSAILDISEHKLVEEALWENEERYRSLFERSLELVYLCDFEGNFIDANDAALEGLGYTKKDIKSINFMSLLDKNQLSEACKQVEEIIKIGPQKDGVEYKLRRKDGEYIHVESKGALIYRDGKPFAIQMIARNITDRKLAEEALRESEKKYRSMMEAMKDRIYICSSDYRVEYMNPAMIKRVGRDATGMNCFKALHGFDEKCPWCVNHIVQQNKCAETDIVSPKDNRSYHITHSPIVHEDGSISKMTVYRDTTDFKKMETQLRQAQKMEAIGTLAGGIAHDFNNILFPMFGYLEMVLQDLPKDNPLRGQLVEVLNGAKRARDLVKQILAFSRQRDHDIKPMKMHLVLKEALKLIKSSLPSTIKITQNIQTDCGLIFADPTQIHQIVMNLCTNAYHAMEETGGKLTVHLKEAELTVEDLKDTAMVPGKHVCLMVTDTGPGMEQSVIDRIFDPYFTTKEKGKGTGLGLSVVDGIVKSHGGHLNVYSEPGKGSEFKVFLPMIKPKEEEHQVETDTPIQKGNDRILLVDDQDMVAQMEKQMLERLGYHVTVRTSSTDALEAFRTQPDKFDVVITDMTMPNMTGDKLAAELIKIRPAIPLILCTGFSEMMSKEKATALGIKGFLMKPVVMKDLSSIIRDVLDNK